MADIAELRHTLGSITSAKEGLQKQVSSKDETIKVRTSDSGSIYLSQAKHKADST